MLIKPAPDLRWRDVTDQGVYLRRREFLGAAGALAAAGVIAGIPRPAAAQGSGAKLPNVKKGPFPTDEAQTPYDAVTTYNNFYEFGVDKDDPSRNAGSLKTRPWTRDDRRRRRQAAAPSRSTTSSSRISSRSASTACAASRRWSMVIPWVGFPLADLLKRVEPTAEREVRGVHDAAGARPDARAAAAGARLAVRRGAAAGRGDAPADDPRRRPLRRGAAESERRAAPARGAVEVRLQEHQVDREHPVRRGPADDRVAEVGAAASTASTRT